MAGLQERRITAGRDEAGFTLIELLVVASILMVLAGMGLAVQYKNGVIRARESVLKTDLFNMRDAIDQKYYADKGQYPGTLDELTSSGYLRRVPDDPFTMSTTTWLTVPSEPGPQQPVGRAGCLRHQEQRRCHRARRHQILRLVRRDARSGNWVVG